MNMPSRSISRPVEHAPKLRVLCAEDDDALGTMLKRALEGAGHHVEWVSDGRDALLRFSADIAAFDVVLTDHHMQTVHGPQLVERLRELGFRGRIIVHSSSLANGVVQHYRRLSVDQILNKPVRLDALVSAVEQSA